MRKTFYLGMTVIVVVILCLLGYGVYLNQRSENIITERMSDRRLPLKGAKAQVRNLHPLVKMDLINLYSNQITDVVSLIEGQVVREFVQPNSYVEVGTPILEIVNETIPLKIKQANSDIAEAQAILTRARNTYSRYEQLVKESAISLEKFDEASAQLSAAQAKLENFLSQKEQLLIQQSRQTINATIRGNVLKIYKPIGSYVTAGMPVALIGNFDKLYFNSSITDNISKNILANQVLKLNFAEGESFSKAYGTKYSTGNKGEKENFTARIVEISPPVSEPATMRQIILEIDNSSGLLEPGLYDNVSITAGFPYKCLTVPLAAMIDDKKHSLFVVLPDGTLKKKFVESGTDDGTYIEILSGLDEGEIVVISETGGLTDGMNVDVKLEESVKADG